MPYLKQAAETAPNDRRTVARYVASGALSDLERRHATSPRDQAVLYDLALAYALTDQTDKARTILAELLRVAPPGGEGLRLPGLDLEEQVDHGLAERPRGTHELAERRAQGSADPLEEDAGGDQQHGVAEHRVAASGGADAAEDDAEASDAAATDDASDAGDQ